MPKTIRNQFYKKLTFEKLLQAHYRARKHKAYKNEVIKFEFNLENNLVNIQNRLKNKTYRLGNYFSFKVYEPKERTIQALPYQDRIVHQWYVEEFIKPYIIPRFIDTTFACLNDRGTHAAVKEVQKQMRIFKRNHGDFWILKCDIKRFFYNINPYILYTIMQKYIQDKDLLFLTQILIFNGPINKNAIGVPIGNYTSQFFANIYLNELDQYIKRVLKIKNYTRYMDDFILILKTKKECIHVKKQIEDFLHSNLRLELNAKSRYYPYKMGVNFCGYRIFLTHRLLRLSSKKKIKKNVKKWNQKFETNSLDLEHTMQQLNSWLGHVEHCNAYNLKQKVLNNCNFLYGSSAVADIEKKLILDIEQDIKNNN